VHLTQVPLVTSTIDTSDLLSAAKEHDDYLLALDEAKQWWTAEDKLSAVLAGLGEADDGSSTLEQLDRWDRATEMFDEQVVIGLRSYLVAEGRALPLPTKPEPVALQPVRGLSPSSPKDRKPPARTAPSRAAQGSGAAASTPPVAQGLSKPASAPPVARNSGTPIVAPPVARGSGTPIVAPPVARGPRPSPSLATTPRPESAAARRARSKPLDLKVPPSEASAPDAGSQPDRPDAKPRMGMSWRERRRRKQKGGDGAKADVNEREAKNREVKTKKSDVKGSEVKNGAGAKRDGGAPSKSPAKRSPAPLKSSPLKGLVEPAQAGATRPRRSNTEARHPPRPRLGTEATLEREAQRPSADPCARARATFGAHRPSDRNAAPNSRQSQRLTHRRGSEARHRAGRSARCSSITEPGVAAPQGKLPHRRRRSPAFHLTVGTDETATAAAATTDSSGFDTADSPPVDAANSAVTSPAPTAVNPFVTFSSCGPERAAGSVENPLGIAATIDVMVEFFDGTGQFSPVSLQLDVPGGETAAIDVPITGIATDASKLQCMAFVRGFDPTSWSMVGEAVPLVDLNAGRQYWSAMDDVVDGEFLPPPEADDPLLATLSGDPEVNARMSSLVSRLAGEPLGADPAVQAHFADEQVDSAMAQVVADIVDPSQIRDQEVDEAMSDVLDRIVAPVDMPTESLLDEDDEQPSATEVAVEPELPAPSGADEDLLHALTDRLGPDLERPAATPISPNSSPTRWSTRLSPPLKAEPESPAVDAPPDGPEPGVEVVPGADPQASVVGVPVAEPAAPHRDTDVSPSYSGADAWQSMAQASTDDFEDLDLEDLDDLEDLEDLEDTEDRQELGDPGGRVIESVVPGSVPIRPGPSSQARGTERGLPQESWPFDERPAQWPRYALIALLVLLCLGFGALVVIGALSRIAAALPAWAVGRNRLGLEQGAESAWHPHQRTSATTRGNCENLHCAARSVGFGALRMSRLYAAKSNSVFRHPASWHCGPIPWQGSRLGGSAVGQRK